MTVVAAVVLVQLVVIGHLQLKVAQAELVYHQI
jgi:hypothetical protein